MLLLDTNALLWGLTDDRRLGGAARELIEEAADRGAASVSAFSFWEVAMLTTKGRLKFGITPEQVRSFALNRGVSELPVTGEIGIAAAQLRGFHPDPADRIIAATALHHRAMLVTADEHILGWDGPLERVDARR